MLNQNGSKKICPSEPDFFCPPMNLPWLSTWWSPWWSTWWLTWWSPWGSLWWSPWEWQTIISDKMWKWNGNKMKTLLPFTKLCQLKFSESLEVYLWLCDMLLCAMHWLNPSRIVSFVLAAFPFQPCLSCFPHPFAKLSQVIFSESLGA